MDELILGCCRAGSGSKTREGRDGKRVASAFPVLGNDSPSQRDGTVHQGYVLCSLQVMVMLASRNKRKG
ncbi:MAG: hypothetical protein QHH75_12085 [Bacillota bacterium]|nr:hypothetical protein [Bacillota bacterium]